MLQDFVQQVKDTAKECMGEIHTAMPGKIVSVSGATATVLPSIKKTLPNGKTMAYPQISGVPIVLPQGYGQKASVCYPVKAGDGCLIIISEQSLENWLYGRETDTTLAFDLSNAICIPGLFTSAPADFAEACSTGAVIVSAGDTKLKVSPSGITFTGDLTIEGNVSVSGTGSFSGDCTAPNINND